jgi:predicted DNA-binding protein with PD1-like motif
MSSTSEVRAIVVRLRPGEDLKRELDALAEREHIEAGAIATCVGSLERVALRFADQHDTTVIEGRHEIVSLVGTLARGGSHLHLAVSDGEGRTTGGHLLAGCRVYTTAEVVLGEARDLVFTRAVDGTTPWRELQIARRRGR